MSTTPTRAKRRREVRVASKRKVPLPPQLKRGGRSRTDRRKLNRSDEAINDFLQ